MLWLLCGLGHTSAGAGHVLPSSSGWRLSFLYGPGVVWAMDLAVPCSVWQGPCCRALSGAQGLRLPSVPSGLPHMQPRMGAETLPAVCAEPVGSRAPSPGSATGPCRLCALTPVRPFFWDLGWTPPLLQYPATCHLLQVDLPGGHAALHSSGTCPRCGSSRHQVRVSGVKGPCMLTKVNGLLGDPSLVTGHCAESAWPQDLFRVTRSLRMWPATRGIVVACCGCAASRPIWTGQGL